MYWNLNKNVWSVMSKRIVISHKDIIILSNVRFIVSENGRKKVLREKLKNVHAFAEGVLVDIGDVSDVDISSNKTRQISYNPYKYSHFFDKENCEMVLSAGVVFMKDKQIFEILS